MSSNLLVDMLLQFRLNIYKKRFERLKSQYNACVFVDERDKVNAKIATLKTKVANLGESGQYLQLEIDQFLAGQEFKIFMRKKPFRTRTDMIDLIKDRESRSFESKSTARKDKPENIKIIK